MSQVDKPLERFTLIRNARLDQRTTFRVPARAAWLADVWKSSALPPLLAETAAGERPLLLLGDGSNILFTRDFEGLVIHLATRGIEILADDGQQATVRSAAGENWDGFVRWTLAHGFSGLENLILIPGTVGAAPIQNIGAYGAEVREFVQAVEAFDIIEQRFTRLSNAACEFAYRDSLFKRRPQRYIVTAVEFLLHRQRPMQLAYSGVRRQLDVMGINRPTPTDLGRAIECLRRGKLPDPTVIGNAGSFFKNPVIPIEHLKLLQRAHPDVPYHAHDHRACKLSAAWLIEACGFKGMREGDAGVADTHALVLVNYGGADGAQVWALAERIRNTVADRFGVSLEPEPLVI